LIKEICEKGLCDYYSFRIVGSEHKVNTHSSKDEVGELPGNDKHNSTETHGVEDRNDSQYHDQGIEDEGRR
jgi:hypothetical protein